MTRTRSLLLAAVAALVGLAAFLGAQNSAQNGAQNGSAARTDDLKALRAEVALGPCPVSLGPDLPALTLPCLGGGPAVPLRGKGSGVPTLVNFYGSWCGPCAKEMPLLVAYSRRAAGRVALLGIDTQDPERNGLLFAKDVGQTWPALVDADGDARRVYSSGAPATLFLDAAGVVTFVKIGAFKDLSQLLALTEQHLQVTV